MPDTPTSVSVTRAIAAPAERVWALVSDVTRMGDWSPETTGAEWVKGATGPVRGARFQGTNRNGKKEWKSVATVVESVPGRVSAFQVKAIGLGVAEWRYTIEPTDAGCAVTESWLDQRGPIMKMLSPKATGVADRAAHNRTGMEQTLERLAAGAESAG